jgi:hypothetical protein
MFNSAARGILYWRKHRHHICYKCRQYGHIAADCDKICTLCGNMHNDTVCVHSIEKFVRKIYGTIMKNVIKDPEKVADKIYETQCRINIENLVKQINKAKELKITSSSFQLEKPKKEVKKTSLDTLFDDMELNLLGIPGVEKISKNKNYRLRKDSKIQGEKKVNAGYDTGFNHPKQVDQGNQANKDYKAIKELTEKIISFKQMGLNTEILETLRNQIEKGIPKQLNIRINDNTYKFEPKQKLPDIKMLEMEKQLDDLKDELKQVQKQKSIYDKAQRLVANYKQLKKDSDFLFGEIQCQRIQLRNIKENKTRIIQETKEKVKQQWENHKKGIKEYKERKLEQLEKNWQKFKQFKEEINEDIKNAEQQNPNEFQYRRWKRRKQQREMERQQEEYEREQREMYGEPEINCSYDYSSS